MSTCKFCNAEIEWIDRVPHNLDHSRHTCQRKQKTPPEPRDCKYECKTLLLWDDYSNAFKEVNTGEIHTIERCHTAKANLAEKNDHGNEETISPKEYVERLETKFVDHTAKGASKVKIFSDEDPDVVEDEYNTFLIHAADGKIKVQGAQFHIGGNEFAIALYYEEIAK